MKKQLINCTSTLVAYKNDIKADYVWSYSPIYAIERVLLTMVPVTLTNYIWSLFESSRTL